MGIQEPKRRKNLKNEDTESFLSGGYTFSAIPPYKHRFRNELRKTKVMIYGIQARPGLSENSIQ